MNNHEEAEVKEAIHIAEAMTKLFIKRRVKEEIAHTAIAMIVALELSTRDEVYQRQFREWFANTVDNLIPVMKTYQMSQTQSRRQRTEPL